MNGFWMSGTDVNYYYLQVLNSQEMFVWMFGSKIASQFCPKPIEIFEHTFSLDDKMNS